jgi:hypothetical protein
MRRLQARPDWDAAVRAVERVKDEAWEGFRDGHGDWGRDLVLYLARRHCGLTLGELRARVGGLDYAAVGMAVRRMGQRLASDPALSKAAQRAEADLW